MAETWSQTPISSNDPYLTVEEFLVRKDIRAIMQLSVDNGTQPDASTADTNARIAACLATASGEVEASLLSAERYSTVDLAAMNGNSQQYVKGIVADLAMYGLCMVRGMIPPDGVMAAYDKAQHDLEALSNGTKILAFAETADAGKAEDEFMTLQDYQRNNRFVDACQRVLGIRQELRRF